MPEPCRWSRWTAAPYGCAALRCGLLVTVSPGPVAPLPYEAPEGSEAGHDCSQ